MDARLLVETKMMKAEQFGLKDVPKEPLVTIAKVTIEPQKGSKETWGILYFKESWAKPLKINRTHQKALMAMFGFETDAWCGKRIGLFAKPGIYFNERGVAVRIKGSPDIKQACSFSVKRFGGGDDTYDLVPMPGASNGTPYDQMWRAFKGAGFKEEAEFKALIKTSTGKATPKQLVDADVARFEVALQEKVNGPPPPMSEDEKAEAIRREQEQAAEPGANG